MTQEEDSVLSLAATETLLFSGGQGAHRSDIHVRLSQEWGRNQCRDRVSESTI